MRKRPKALPMHVINGWSVEKCPNTFAEKFAYRATANDPTGYQTASKGFQRLRDAREYCLATPPPTARTTPLVEDADNG